MFDLCMGLRTKKSIGDMKLVPYKNVNRDGKLYIQFKPKDGETKVQS